MEDQNNNLGATLGEISTIRNILMGGQMQQYDQTFADIDNKINANAKDADERLKALEQQMNNKFEALQKEMNDRFDKLETLLTENAEKLNERINAVSTTDKTDLGLLLAEVSNRLING